MRYNDPCDEWPVEGRLVYRTNFLTEVREVYLWLCERTFRSWIPHHPMWQRGLFSRWGEDRVLTYLNRLPEPSMAQFYAIKGHDEDET